MRGQKAIAIAVRRPNGKLAVNTRPLSPIYTGRFRRTPFTRGIIVLIESLMLGISSLVYSANVALEEEGEKISGGSTWLLMLFSLGFAVSLFFLAPLFLTKLLDPYIDSSLLFHLVEGAIRLVIFLGFLKFIRQSMLMRMERRWKRKKSVNTAPPTPAAAPPSYWRY